MEKERNSRESDGGRAASEGQVRNYKETLCLPKTEFAMRANLAKREPEFIRRWESIDLYRKMQERRAGCPTFILHDGPPYANGNIHIGTAFNKILKDFFPKYKSLRGFRSPYVPGWDTHGLPIELKVLKEEAGAEEVQNDPVELRRRCEAYARRFMAVQRDEFRRLGVLGDWENPYLTLTPDYEAAQIDAFADMVEKGLVYKGRKPVFWCVDCRTALAAAEIEYEDETSPSIHVAYPLRDAAEHFPELAGRETSVVIWTTTPWTLPASLAVALHPDYEYGFYATEEGHCLLLAVERAVAFREETRIALRDPILRVRGAALEGLSATHPYLEDRAIPLVLADYVVLDTGTGCVHTAPGHGVEDFETGVRYGLEILNPVDDAGFFLLGTPLVGGKSLKEGEPIVLEEIARRGRLLGKGKIRHSYPHCWRCKRPVVFRATEQWFVDVNKFRDSAMAVIDREVEWVPSWGKDRIGNMVRDRSDWCISRQRIWGVPIPAFYCESCGRTVLTPDRVRRVAEAIRRQGSHVWWSASPEELLGDIARCPHCGSGSLRKERDIMDVWFDSGCSHRAVLETRPELSWPADLYLEGSDQHRGWFQTSLLTSVATRGSAPFRSVLTHGFIVDGEGRKMSKSIGNVIAPQEVIDRLGADVLRLWVASTDYRNDIRISKTILDNLTESYRKIRNTIRFLLGNLDGFDPRRDRVERKDLLSLDRWLLRKLHRMIDRVTRGYDACEFHVPTFQAHQFCDNELSALYLDVNKDRLYADTPAGIRRRSAQSALWECLTALTRILAPILSFTMEEAWIEARKLNPELPESVFLSDWPEADLSDLPEEEEALWDRRLEVRGAMTRALEAARGTAGIGNSLDAALDLRLSEAYQDLASTPVEVWAELAIVSEVALSEEPGGALVHSDPETGCVVGVRATAHEKCPRCWKRLPEVARQGLCDRCAKVLEGRESA
jgi:isoleucyl-tRNA synthetase